VSQLLVLPRVATIAPGTDTQFVALGIRANSETTVVAPTWSTSVGSISAAGRYSAPGAAGVAIVRANLNGLNDSALVTIQSPVVKLIVLPESVAVLTGDSVLFHAFGIDAAFDTTPATALWGASAGSMRVTGEWVAPGTAGSVTITATNGALSGHANAQVSLRAGCGTSGSGAAIDSVSRDVGSAAGGTPVAIYGSGFLASDCAYFGSRLGTVDSVTSGVLYARTPADTTITASDPVSIVVQQNGHSTFATDQFDYEPTLKTTYVSQDFENGTVAPFLAGKDSAGVVAIDSTYAHSGKLSVKCSIHPHAAITIARLESKFGGALNPPLNSATGVYQRWYILVPQYTLDSSASGQIKLHLERVNATQPPPGWFMLGEGSQFGSTPKGEVVAFGDDGIFVLPGGHTKAVLTAGVWMEIETWYKRTTGVGHAKLWVNGRLKVDTTSAVFGSDNATDALTMYIGLVYAQALTGQVAVWVDDAAAADGFLE